MTEGRDREHELASVKAEASLVGRFVGPAFECAVVGMELLSPGGLILAVNDAACHMLRRPRSQLVGARFQGLTWPSDLEAEEAAVTDMLAGRRQTYVAFKQYLLPDGRAQPLQLSKRVIRDRRGHPEGFLSQLVDLKEVRLAEREATLFRDLVESSRDFIAVADLEGNVQFVSRAGRELAGIPDEVDITSTTIADYLTAEGLQASVEVEQPAVVRDGFWHGTSTLRHWPTGRGIPVDIISFLVIDQFSGQPEALATVQRDLRPQMRVQQRAARMERSRRDALQRIVNTHEVERRRLAGDLHDDAVQVLSAILIRLQIHAERMASDGNQDEAQWSRSLSEDIRDVVDRLRRQVFVLASLQHRPSIRDGLQEVAEKVLRPAGVTWTLDVEVESLPDGVFEIFWRTELEALTNVVKHAGARRVRMVVDASAGRWRLTVADDGAGAPASALRSRGHYGVRLMRDRLAASGGSLRFSRPDGGGTRLTALLPKDAASGTVTRRRPSASLESTSERASHHLSGAHRAPLQAG